MSVRQGLAKELWYSCTDSKTVTEVMITKASVRSDVKVSVISSEWLAMMKYVKVTGWVSREGSYTRVNVVYSRLSTDLHT